MTHTPQIKAVSTDYSPVDKNYFLSVTVEFYKEDVLKAVRSLGFPLDTTADEIRESLKKYALTLDHDEQMALETSELERLNALAEETKKELLRDLVKE